MAYSFYNLHLIHSSYLFVSLFNFNFAIFWWNSQFFHLFIICFAVSLSILNTITWKFLTNNYNKKQLCICFNYFFFSLFLNSCSCLLLKLVIFLACQIWHIKFSDPRTVAHQAHLSMELSRQEHWSGLPFPSPGDLSHPGIKPASLASPALAGRFFTSQDLLHLSSQDSGSTGDSSPTLLATFLHVRFCLLELSTVS